MEGLSKDLLPSNKGMCWRLVHINFFLNMPSEPALQQSRINCCCVTFATRPQFLPAMTSRLQRRPYSRIVLLSLIYQLYIQIGSHLGPCRQIYMRPTAQCRYDCPASLKKNKPYYPLLAPLPFQLHRS